MELGCHWQFLVTSWCLQSHTLINSIKKNLWTFHPSCCFRPALKSVWRTERVHWSLDVRVRQVGRPEKLWAVAALWEESRSSRQCWRTPHLPRTGITGRRSSAKKSGLNFQEACAPWWVSWCPLTFPRKEFNKRMTRKFSNVLTNSWTFIKVLDRCVKRAFSSPPWPPTQDMNAPEKNTHKFYIKKHFKWVSKGHLPLIYEHSFGRCSFGPFLLIKSFVPGSLSWFFKQQCGQKNGLPTSLLNADNISPISRRVTVPCTLRNDRSIFWICSTDRPLGCTPQINRNVQMKWWISKQSSTL